MLTRLFLLSPPPGVHDPDFDRWYVGVHAQEARLLPNICRYVSYRGEAVPADVPGLESNWYRLTEVSTADLGPAAPPQWTPPPYPQRTSCSTDWWEERTILIADKPEYDLLREVPDFGRREQAE